MDMDDLMHNDFRRTPKFQAIVDHAGNVGNGGYGGVFQQPPMGLQPLQSTSQGLQDLLATPAPDMGQGLDQFGSDDMWVDFFPGLLSQSPA